MKESESKPASVMTGDIAAKPDSDWTSPLHSDDFRQKYFFRVYGFLCAQFAIICSVIALFAT